MSRPAIWFLSFAALAVLIVAAAALAVPEIERDLEDAARRTLAEQGLQDAVSVRADGRDLLVASDEPALAKRAATVLAGVHGARSARIVPPDAGEPLPETELLGPFALRPLSGGGVALYGSVPNTTVRERLLAAARQAFPSADVRDGMAVDSTASADWADDVAAALLRLRTVQNPGLDVTEDGGLVASGQVDTEAARANTIARLAEVVEPRQVRNALAIRTPVPPEPDPAPEPDAPTEAADTPPVAEAAPDSSAAPAPRRPGRVEVQSALSGAEADALAQTLRQRLGTGSATFEAGSTRLTEGSADVLRRAASVLKAHPQFVIELQAHADPSERNAFDLSAARARAAKRVLTEAGVPFEQIEAAAYSDSTPLTRGTSDAERERNRRVVIKLLRRR
ncbi:MAG TPA: OmpA family protein [Rhodothermales bacterium]|nr:OmpA family protein [Rhodothermales bacterium]